MVRQNSKEVVNAVGEDLAAVLPSYGRAFWRVPHLLHLNAILLVPMFSSATIGYDGAMMNALQIAPFWKKHFHSPSGSQLGAINAIFPVGKICGLALVTPLSDKFGRRPVLIVAFCICIIGSVVQAVSVNLGMLIFSRWLIGVGTAFMAQPSPILIAELAYPTHRSKLTALFNTFYYFGAIFSAWLTYGTIRQYQSDWSWRIPSLLQAGFPLVQLVFSVFLPESPRWLMANGKTEEARFILTRYHTGGDESSTLVEYEIQSIENTLRLERESDQSKVRQLFATAANRRRTSIALTLGFFSQWVGNGVVTYYLALALDTIGITDALDQSLINGGLQIFNFTASVLVGALMVDRLGRRVLFLWSACGMCLSYIAWTALNSQFISTHSNGIGIAVVPMIFVFYFHYDIAFTPLLYAYPTEIFPYMLRGLGVTTTYLVGHLGLIVSLFVNPIAMKAISWKFYILFCVLNAILLIIVWFIFPETNGHSLEEIALLRVKVEPATAMLQHTVRILIAIED
ncbi:general substrate transporter [Xylogone sp. PMI_703]|nr:general substrate transporter [Xylogone sp. PMI_703]